MPSKRNMGDDALKATVEAYLAKASREDVIELLEEARSRLTDDATAMWEGEDSDFFPLPEEGPIRREQSRGNYWWCRIGHWFWMRVVHEHLGGDAVEHATTWRCRRCGRWWKRVKKPGEKRLTIEGDPSEESKFMREVAEDLRTL